jgi:uncharacterized membrane protein
MTLDPLLSAPFTIQIHAISALLALPLGAVVLWGRKGTTGHRHLGRLWVALMAVAAMSALFIHESGPHLFGLFGPVHVFALLTLNGLAYAMWKIIVRRDVAAHARVLRMVYTQAVLVSAALTLLPSRRMNEVVFGGDGDGPLIYALVAFAVSGTLGLAYAPRPNLRKIVARPQFPRRRQPSVSHLRSTLSGTI